MEMQMSAATTMCVHFGYKGFGEFCRESVLQLQSSSDILALSAKRRSLGSWDTDNQSTTWDIFQGVCWQMWDLTLSCKQGSCDITSQCCQCHGFLLSGQEETKDGWIGKEHPVNKFSEKYQMIMGEKFSKLRYSHCGECDIALRYRTVRWNLRMGCKILCVSQVMHSLC